MEENTKIEPVKEKQYVQYSKTIISDIRTLLWIITLGGIALAFYCVHTQYTGAIEWISLMVTAAWSAHGVCVSFYLNKSKHEHLNGGTEYARMEADILQEQYSMFNIGDNTSEGVDCDGLANGN